MPFDEKKFERAKLEPRVAFVDVPELKTFFTENEKPRWKVRGMTGNEQGKINGAVERNKSVSTIIDGLISANAKDKVDALKKSIGLGDDVPHDIVRRLEMMTVASIGPVIKHETAVKLCEKFPVEFYEITNMILKLTGRGSEVKRDAKALWADADIRASLALCYDKKTYLYQVRPDIMPYDYLSDLEILLWDLFYADLQKKSGKK